MSMHRSLKTKPSGLNQHRNVLSRDERIDHLQGKGEFDPEADSPFGLVKVGNRKVQTKKKKAEDETAEGVEGVEGAEGEGGAEGAEGAGAAAEGSS